MTLQKKIIVALSALIGLMALMAGFIVYSLVQQQRAANEEDRIVRAAEAAMLLDIDVLRVTVLLQQYTDSRDPAKLNEIQENRKSAINREADLRHLTRLPEVTQALDRFDAVMPERKALGDRIIEATNQARPLDEIAALRLERNRLDDEARKHLRTILEAEKKALYQAVSNARAANTRLRQNVIGALAAFSVAAIAISLMLGHHLLHSLRQLNRMASEVGHGHLNARNHVTRDDEIGDLAKTLNTMAGRLQQADRAKDQFVSLASHQLRSPATAVKQYVGMVEAGFAGEITPDQKELLQQALASNERQLHTIDDLLTMARIDAGTMRLKLQPHDLGGLLDSIARDYRTIAGGRKQKLRLKLPERPVPVACDERWLRMAIENIVDNACKYTPDKGNITLRLQKLSNSVRIDVSDTGVGIRKEDLHRLFGKFSRIDNSLSDNGTNGNGIGLHLAQQIVQLHDGSITVDSEPGKGTTFSITLPVDSATAKACKD